jgi:hypothetical protein
VDLNLITVGERQNEVPLLAFKTLLRTGANSSTQELNHTLRILKLSDALMLAKQEHYDQIDPFLKILVIPNQLGISNDLRLWLMNQAGFCFDTLYWSELITQYISNYNDSNDDNYMIHKGFRSSLTESERATLTDMIWCNSTYFSEWRHAMVAVKQQDYTYDHPLFHIQKLFLDFNNLQRFEATGMPITQFHPF